MRVGRSAWLILLGAVAAVVLWLRFWGSGPGGVDRLSSESGPEANIEKPSPGGSPENPLPPEPSVSLGASEAEKRSSPIPQIPQVRLAARTRAILESYQQDGNARVLDALVRPRPTADAIRGALKIASGFDQPRREEALATLQLHSSPELRSIVESIATSDPDPALRTLALDLMQRLDQ